MKQLITISQIIFISFSLNNCSPAKVTPSQNEALNTVSKSTAATKKAGSMQNALDHWLKTDWEPTVAKDPTIQKKYMKKSKESTKKGTTTKKTTHYVEKKERNFTLQEYVDKAAAYIKAKPDDSNNSLVKKMESLPVIGK